jgi:hypothetical protein
MTSIAPVYATWNPSDKGTAVILSNGNLTSASSGIVGTVRSTASKNAGKWYWELHIDSAYGDPNPYAWAGICTSGMDVNYYYSFTAVAYGIAMSQASTIYNETGGTHLATLGSTTLFTGDVLGIALDLVGNTIAYYANGSLMATQNIQPGTYFAAVENASASPLDNQTTANFGATAFSYPPPAGYNAGLY